MTVVLSRVVLYACCGLCLPHRWLRFRRWLSALLRSGTALRFVPCLVRAPAASGSLSSSLRSSSTRAAACAWRRVGSWRLSVVLEVKVNGASGGPGSGKQLACRPAGCLLGGGVRLAVPLAWPRRQPGTCRECNRRRRRFVVNIVFAGCTPGRTLVGLRLPGEGNNQPQQRRVRCTQPRPRTHCPMQNRASETPSDPEPSQPSRDGEKSPQTNHPTPTPRGNLTSSARTDPRRTISPEAPRTNLTAQFHLERPI